MHRSRGFSALELLAVLAIFGLLAAIALPDLFAVRRQVDLPRLARQIAGDARICRQEALVSAAQHRAGVLRGQGKVGVPHGRGRQPQRHSPPGLPGRTRPGDRPQRLGGVPELRDPGGRSARLAGARTPEAAAPWRGDGYRLGRSNIISFSQLGHASPCSVYFNDGRERMLAVRINGETGRIRALEWRRGWRAWREIVL